MRHVSCRFAHAGAPTLARIGQLTLVAALLGCGPTPTATTPASGPGSAPASGAQVAGGELGPAAEPGDVVLVARWKSPVTTLDALSSCAGLPPGMVSDEMVRKLLIETFIKEELPGIDSPGALAGLVALNAPVDSVMSLDDKKQRSKKLPIAFSIGLTSLERAKQALGVQGQPELVPGVWRIGGKRRKTDLVCGVAAAAGSAPARLVCGPDEKSITTLGPYLARTLPTTAPPSTDLHAEFRIKPIEARHGAEARQLLKGLPIIAQSELAIGDKKFDSALIDAASGVSDELDSLMSDLDRVTMDFAVTRQSCLTASGALQLKGKKSWVASTMLERPERAGPPPPIFWRLPKDSDSALYTRGVDPARYAGILKTLRSLTEGALTKYQVGSAADRKALVDLINLPLGKDTNVVQASGHLVAAPAPAKAGAKPSPQQTMDAAMNAALGWYVIGVDEGPATLTKTIKDFVALYNKGSLLAPLKKELSKDTVKMLPSIRTVGAPAPLGSGALDVEIKVTNIPAPGDAAAGVEDPKKAKAKPAQTVTFTGHLLVMADGNATWLAFGTNRDELVKHLLAVKSGAPDSGTIAARQGVEALKGGRHMSGGFMTIGYFTKTVASSLGDLATPMGGNASKVIGVLNGLPHSGETPMVMVSNVAAGASPQLETTINIPKESFEDLGAIVVKAIALASPGPGRP